MGIYVKFYHDHVSITNFSSELDTTFRNNQTVLFQITLNITFAYTIDLFVFSIIDNHFDFGCHSNEICSL